MQEAAITFRHLAYITP